MEFSRFAKKRKLNIQAFDEFPQFTLHRSLSDRKLNDETLFKRPGMFSPDPFRSNEKPKTGIKLKPVLVKERAFPVHLRKTPGISIKLPEISKEGPLKYSQHFFPLTSSESSIKALNRDNNSLVLCNKSREDQSKKPSKLIQLNRRNENKYFPYDVIDVSFGK